MRGFRFLHAADLHLDSPFRGLSEVPRPIREVIRGSTLSALDRLTELAIRERVNFVVIAGDVYDLEDRSVRAQLRFQRAAERRRRRASASISPMAITIPSMGSSFLGSRLPA